MYPFKESYADFLAKIEAVLPDYFPLQAEEQGGLVADAARYSLLAGGKRIRPVLLLSTCQMLGYDVKRAMPYACALEMIHTYSLIHDDLPCMDNDDLRRGRPTCHKVYGEAMAVLAGDALLNRAFEVLLEAVTVFEPGTLDAARHIAAAAGSKGMIGGQTLDLAAEGKMIPLDNLRQLHRMKTGALILAPVMAAAALASAGSDITRILEEYALAIGLAFQIQDDILDVTSNSETMGKTTGKDQRDLKSTYVSLLGLGEAKMQLEATINQARQSLAALQATGLDTGFLNGLTDFLLVRLS